MENGCRERYDMSFHFFLILSDSFMCTCVNVVFIEEYYIETLCITEVLLVISLLIRGVDILYSWSGFEIAILFGETTVCLMYFFLMVFITWGRFAEIKLDLKYSLYCNSKKTKALLVITFFISLSLFIVLLSIQFITNGAWDYELLPDTLCIVSIPWYFYFFRSFCILLYFYEIAQKSNCSVKDSQTTGTTNELFKFKKCNQVKK